MSRVLIVEDTASFRQLATSYLRAQGYNVVAAASLAAARRVIPRARPDVILLDLELGDGEGTSLLCEAARDASTIVVSARPDAEARVRCLELGAADFMVKPIDFRELVLRMRRARPARAAADAPTAPDPGAMALTQAEHRLARLFADAGGRVLTRDDIARRALHRSDAGAGRAVDNLVSRLRRKFNRLEPPRVIWSVRGEGYRLAARSEPPRGPAA